MSALDSVLRSAFGLADAVLHRKNDLTIVTASDLTHERSLLNFLASAARNESRTPLIVYDLGLSLPCRSKLKDDFPGIDVRAFPYSDFPEFLDVRVNAGEYAWKPQIIRAVARERGGLIAWMDAGNIIRYPLFRLRRYARRLGFYAQMSGGTVGDWTHPGMLTYLGLPLEWRSEATNLQASGIIFDTNNAGAAQLLKAWADNALIKDCIAPVGSSRENHRQDQALLTVLFHKSVPSASLPRYYRPEFISHQDVD